METVKESQKQVNGTIKGCPIIVTKLPRIREKYIKLFAGNLATGLKMEKAYPTFLFELPFRKGFDVYWIL
jgi:hypothetical protein